LVGGKKNDLVEVEYTLPQGPGGPWRGDPTPVILLQWEGLYSRFFAMNFLSFALKNKNKILLQWISNSEYG
jgi:hypothetical protein